MRKTTMHSALAAISLFLLSANAMASDSTTTAMSTQQPTERAQSEAADAALHDGALQASEVLSAARRLADTFPEEPFYPVMHPAEIEWLILQSLASESVDAFNDERYSAERISEISRAIATVCESLDCVIAALATGFQETRWRPQLVGPAGECGWAQQTPRYADDVPELEHLTSRERCELLQTDMHVAVRQWHAKRQQKIERHGDRWPCYYNAGYICTPQGQHYWALHLAYREMYAGMMGTSAAAALVN